jgi:hypothetical protein
MGNQENRRRVRLAEVTYAPAQNGRLEIGHVIQEALADISLKICEVQRKTSLKKPDTIIKSKAGLLQIPNIRGKKKERKES